MQLLSRLPPPPGTPEPTPGFAIMDLEVLDVVRFAGHVLFHLLPKALAFVPKALAFVLAPVLWVARPCFALSWKLIGLLIGLLLTPVLFLWTLSKWWADWCISIFEALEVSTHPGPHILVCVLTPPPSR